MNYNLNNKENFAWYVTGMTDGDGGFIVGIIKSTNSVGWSVRLIYSIVASNNYANRLMLIKRYYELRIMKCHLQPKGTSLHKAWVEFNKNWLNYNYY